MSGTRSIAQIQDDTFRKHILNESNEWMYLSFVDDDTGKFLGGCIVHGSDVLEAVTIAHLLNVNPGGQVLGIGPLAREHLDQFPPEYRNKLLDEKTIRERFGGKSLREKLEP